MKNKKHQKLYDHYKEVFGQEPIFSLQLKKNVLPNDMKPITTFVFKPTEEMPFWKLCTIGASDYLMPERDIGWGRKANRRNEYVMFISKEVEISESTTEWLSLNSLIYKLNDSSCDCRNRTSISLKIAVAATNKFIFFSLLPKLTK